MKPETVWRFSRILHARGHRRLARVLKALNDIVFRAILPPEATVGRGLRLGHHGTGVVIHPNVTIGDDVQIWHQVTLSVSSYVGSDVSITIEDGVSIGAGAIVITPENSSIRVGRGSVIGAHAVVTKDIDPYSVVVGNPARVVRTLTP